MYGYGLLITVFIEGARLWR